METESNLNPSNASAVNTFVAAEIERLRARIAELEAIHAVTLGTLEQPTNDAPFHLEHDVPPSTPR